MTAHFARVDVAKLHPHLDLRFPNGQELACTLHVHVASEIVDTRELMLDGFAHGANKNLVRDFDTQHK